MADEQKPQPDSKPATQKAEPTPVTKEQLDALAGRIKKMEDLLTEFIGEVRHKLTH